MCLPPMTPLGTPFPPYKMIEINNFSININLFKVINVILIFILISSTFALYSTEPYKSGDEKYIEGGIQFHQQNYDK